MTLRFAPLIYKGAFATLLTLVSFACLAVGNEGITWFTANRNHNLPDVDALYSFEGYAEPVDVPSAHTARLDFRLPPVFRQVVTQNLFQVERVHGFVPMEPLTVTTSMFNVFDHPAYRSVSTVSVPVISVRVENYTSVANGYFTVLMSIRNPSANTTQLGDWNGPLPIPGGGQVPHAFQVCLSVEPDAEPGSFTTLYTSYEASPVDSDKANLQSVTNSFTESASSFSFNLLPLLPLNDSFVMELLLPPSLSLSNVASVSPTVSATGWTFSPLSLTNRIISIIATSALTPATSPAPTFTITFNPLSGLPVGSHPLLTNIKTLGGTSLAVLSPAINVTYPQRITFEVLPGSFFTGQSSVPLTFRTTISAPLPGNAKFVFTLPNAFTFTSSLLCIVTLANNSLPAVCTHDVGSQSTMINVTLSSAIPLSMFPSAASPTPTNYLTSDVMGAVTPATLQFTMHYYTNPVASIPAFQLLPKDFTLTLESDNVVLDTASPLNLHFPKLINRYLRTGEPANDGFISSGGINATSKSFPLGLPGNFSLLFKASADVDSQGDPQTYYVALPYFTFSPDFSGLTVEEEGISLGSIPLTILPLSSTTFDPKFSSLSHRPSQTVSFILPSGAKAGKVYSLNFTQVLTPNHFTYPDHATYERSIALFAVNPNGYTVAILGYSLPTVSVPPSFPSLSFAGSPSINLDSLSLILFDFAASQSVTRPFLRIELLDAVSLHPSANSCLFTNSQTGVKSVLPFTTVSTTYDGTGFIEVDLPSTLTSPVVATLTLPFVLPGINTNPARFSLSLGSRDPTSSISYFGQLSLPLLDVPPVAFTTRTFSFAPRTPSMPTTISLSVVLNTAFYIRSASSIHISLPYSFTLPPSPRVHLTQPFEMEIPTSSIFSDPISGRLILKNVLTPSNSWPPSPFVDTTPTLPVLVRIEGVTAPPIDGLTSDSATFAIVNSVCRVFPALPSCLLFLAF